MTTLEDAWMWYQATLQGAKRLLHLAKYWDQFPWDSDNGWIAEIQQDNVLRYLDAEELATSAQRVANDLNDHAVLMMFSVFEAIVRDSVVDELTPELTHLRHPILVKAGQDVLDAVSEGSFYRVLEPYKGIIDKDLVEQVNQVRRYRNWVAHGRRTEKMPSASISPIDAYNRLRQLLNQLST